MTKVTSGRTCAFGELNASLSQVRKDLDRALTKAQRVNTQADVNPQDYDRVRRSIAMALRLDVVFSPRLEVEYRNSYWPNSRLPIHRRWNISPVWKTAPRGAYYKANRFCSLLHTIAAEGYKANISKELLRLSIHMWKMSKKDFDGLRHRVFARIAKASRASQNRSKPDPLQSSGTLSKNPVCVPNRVHRHPGRIDGCIASRIRVKHAPKFLGVLVVELGKLAFSQDLKRSRRHVPQMVNTTRTRLREGLLPETTVR